jgi:lysine-specific permease
MKNQNTKLARRLTARQISMIAIGGSIGTGIFITSGNALYIAGPGGAILAYLLISVMVYFLMTSLGEMAALIPVTGSFCDYCTRFVSPAFGFSMSYNYWFNWAITVAVDLSSAALIMQYWFPHTPFLLWSGLFFCLILILNLFSINLYGEIEYWFSTIKVSTIIIFLVVSSLIIAGLFGHQHVSYHNWTIGDAPFHHGWIGFLSVFMIAGFAFQGTEIFGITAGEMKNPKTSVPKAVKTIFWRILLFYIASMLAISVIIPYTNPSLLNSNIQNVALSPFTMIFKTTGFRFITSIINVVILTAVLSACNSSVYTGTRMLWHISNEGNAPRFLSMTNKKGVPMLALLATIFIGAFAFLASIFSVGTIFMWLIQISSLSGFIAWLGIGISHYRFRKSYISKGKKLENLPYLAKFFPFGPIFAIVFCCLIILGQQYVDFIQGTLSFSSILKTYMGIPIFFLLYFGYKVTNALRSKRPSDIYCVES